jgi:hypothetical protein
MSDDPQIVHMTSGQLTFLAQSDPGPFVPPLCLRSFWCGKLAERWNLSGPVTKLDFMMMASCKRPREMLTQEAIDHFKAVKDNHLLSAAWGIQFVQPTNFEEFVERDPRLVDAVEESLRETFSDAFESKIYASVPGAKPKKTCIGVFCAFIYTDKSLCFLLDVTLVEGAPLSYPIDEKMLLGGTSEGWATRQSAG